jgi:hypothetical protein
MRVLSFLAALVFTASCGGGGGNDAALDAGVVDAGHDAAPITHHDMSPLVTLPIGAACKISVECGDGGHCLLPHDGYPNGYCTKGCRSDQDCGDNHFCFSGDCVVGCKNESDCRETEGYACWIVGGGINICLADQQSDPTLNLCDPTADDGTCTTAEDVLGGCIRYRLGSGSAGTCQASCVIGPGTCPLANGYLQECVVFDQRNGSATANGDYGDLFVGGICQPILDSAIAGGEVCLYPNNSDNPSYVYNACVDGYVCDVDDYVDSDGDNKCHALCYPNGAPDGGAAIPDGGMVAAPCDGTCKPIWGNVNLGLCIPKVTSPPDMGDMGVD